MNPIFLRPIRRFVLLLDDRPEETVDGVIVKKELGCDHHDFIVARVGDLEAVEDFGPGDRVIVKDPNCGRRVMVDGVLYRLVRVSDIIAVM